MDSDPKIYCHRKIFTAALIVALSIAGWTRNLVAADFRIESKVYSGTSDTPTSESLTVFVGDRAYDFLNAPREITVFDFSSDRIALLDPTRSVRTELTTEKLAGFAEQMRSRAARQTDHLLKFAAQPEFDESQRDGWQRFASPLLTYRVQAAKVDDPTVAHEYRQFCDNSARLNSMLHPGAMPPFPRLAVNAALERAGQLPEQVEVTVGATGQSGRKPTELRSDHHLSMRLLPADHQRVDEAEANLKTFKQISWDEYLRPVQQAKR